MGFNGDFMGFNGGLMGSMGFMATTGIDPMGSIWDSQWILMTAGIHWDLSWD